MKLDRQTQAKFSGSNILSPLQEESTLSELFHENTKLTPISGRAYGIRVASIGGNPEMMRILSQAHKLYSLMDRVELPAAAADTPLSELIARRRSVRSYSGEPVTLGELSRLLTFSYGIPRSSSDTFGNPQGRFRAVASGGALYPLELYVCALNVTGLLPGVYHFNSEDQCLDILLRGDFKPQLSKILFLDSMDLDSAALVLVVTSVFRRMTFKYQDRGYRMVLLEAGELAQNFQLEAVEMGLGSCLMGGFLDDQLSELLGIDGVSEAPLLPILAGRMPHAKPAAEATAEAAASGGNGHAGGHSGGQE